MSFPRDRPLTFAAGHHKKGYSDKLFKLYRKARTVGEYFDLHPGDTAQTRQRFGNDSNSRLDTKRASTDLAYDLSKGICSIPGYHPKGTLRLVTLAIDENPAAPLGGRAPPGGCTPASCARLELQKPPETAVVTFLGTGLNGGEAFSRSVRTLQALREAVRSEPWT